MPELPEVETFRRFLLPRLKNKVIKSVNVYWSRLIKKPTNLDIFFKGLINQKFHDVKRRGKYLLFILDHHVLITHLRMEGRFFVTENDQSALMRNCLCKFALSDNHFLYYVDSRHFGTFHLEDKKDYFQHSGLKKLGLEPFDSQLTVSYLMNAWKKRTIAIKVALLEQTVITGIGNIYACEVLFLAKISPWKITNQLSTKSLKLIILHLQKVMQEAIAMKGTTIHTFSVNNQKGLYFSQLRVYAREHKPCLDCQTPILKKQINGRGTYYCPRCQRNN